MRFKTLMTIKALVCLGFAPVLLLFPAWIVGLLGAAYCSGTALTAREYGAALAGNLLLTWLARDVDRGPVRKAIVWNLFVYDLIGLVATAALVLRGTLNPLGWGIVFVYLFFTAGFGWFALSRN
jgi:hypothetical protein